MTAGFSPATANWFAGAFDSPTPAQRGAWTAIRQGDDTLVVAPTGSGKTLAAFLQAIDRLLSEPTPVDRLGRCRVLYVSPLKALAVDVERNLRSPLIGIEREAARLGLAVPDVRIGIRTGDTPPAERARMGRRPPDILITTPESLFLMLTSRARESLRAVHTVIVDEVHAVAGTKRGAHLAVSLDRLDALLSSPAQRIGLSATVSPIADVAAFLRPQSPATVVAPPSEKSWDLQIRVPVDDMADLPASADGSQDAGADPVPRSSIWPHIDEQLVDLIEEHQATLVFANSRRLAERITAQVNDIAAERRLAAGLPEAGPVARAHHGSVSKEQRAFIEEELKAGRLPAVVATSSLELGIDMGTIDLVVQVETPPSVASGLQRVGRAGHQVGATSRGIIFPKFRGDLVTAAVVADGMRSGRIEDVRIPRNPLDVLAQQIAACVAMDDWQADDLLDLMRRSASFSTLTDQVFASVLDLLSGRYPSDEFAELRPRLVWDRTSGLLSTRPGAQRLAVTSGGTIPDRGLFTVFLVGGSRVGELDEEMVYESRVGDVIALGASGWRIEEITHDRVLVTPAPGVPGRLPFWHGDALGRPAALGRAVGAFVRTVAASRHPRDAVAGMGLDERAVANLIGYIEEQRAATHHVPSDTSIVVERFRDELGDWRVIVHSPFGARVHAPWALALGARIRDHLGIDAHVMHADDGIVLRLPDTDDEQAAASVAELIRIDPEEIEGIVTAQVGGSALFAARFRECAARALLLPRRRPDRRSPLWQQRQRSAHLLEVASGYASFPIILETVRECLQDVYDVPALRALLAELRDGTVTVHEVATDHPSPFAESLLFGYVASFLYEGDSPLAERRAEALTLDTRLLAELLGTPELRDLLDADAIDEVEAELQRTASTHRARDVEDAADILRILGPLTDAQGVERGIHPDWLASLRQSRRAIEVRMGGQARTAAVEDAGRLRDALGLALPVGVPDAHLETVDDPLGDVVGRFARTHGPFTREQAAADLGLPPAMAGEVLDRLASAGRVVRGEFRPGGAHTEYCDSEVLRRIRRRSIARLRDEIEPVPPEAFASFLPTWQRVAAHGERPALRGVDGCFEVIEQLAGVALPASTWLRGVFASRVGDFHPGMVDELMTAGEVSWWGLAPLSGGDGVVALAPADRAPALRPAARDEADHSPLELAVLDVLRPGGALFFRDVGDRVGTELGAVPDRELVEALWSLVWSGVVTNDSWSPLRARIDGRGSTRPTQGRRRPALPSRSGPPAASGRWVVTADGHVTPAERARAVGDALLERYGIVTRGSVANERIEGGFAALYRVLSAFEDAGRCRRTYAVDGLGAAQFAVAVAVDRLRGLRREREPRVVVLAATDPAQAYGAALPWPALPEGAGRPARRAGAVVVLVDGSPVAYVDRGGRSALAWTQDASLLVPAMRALAADGERAGLGRAVLQRVNGTALADAAGFASALGEAGFVATPKGLRPPRG
ncbi:MAG: DEAD/DEAH box helicase [Actinomycetota bacterium]|nr:DEAD/DEAH box helicase [Actinomycetota bacterium]